MSAASTISWLAPGPSEEPSPSEELSPGESRRTAGFAVRVMLLAVAEFAVMLPRLALAVPPLGATNCSGCHASAPVAGTGGTINGMDASALGSMLLDYRSGARASTVMGRLMKGFSPAEIHAIAAWISAQKPGVP